MIHEQEERDIPVALFFSSLGRHRARTPHW
jgi:hypothetical protein